MELATEKQMKEFAEYINALDDVVDIEYALKTFSLHLMEGESEAMSIAFAKREAGL